MKTTLPQDKKFGQKFTHNDANAVKAAITELDGNISNINSLNLWIPKDAKANKAAIVTAYPTPAKNWAAMALDDGYIYVNDGLGALAANWVNSGQKAFPTDLATKQFVNNSLGESISILPTTTYLNDHVFSVECSAGNVYFDSRNKISKNKKLKYVSLICNIPGSFSILIYDLTYNLKLTIPVILIEGLNKIEIADNLIDYSEESYVAVKGTVGTIKLVYPSINEFGYRIISDGIIEPEQYYYGYQIEILDISNSFEVRLIAVENSLGLSGADISTLLSKSDDVRLEGKDYLITSPIVLTSGKSITGVLGKTRLLLSGGCLTAISAIGANGIKLSDFEIVGTCPNYSYDMNGIIAGAGYNVITTEANALAFLYIGTEKGIYLESCEKVILSNLIIRNINGSALRVNRVGRDYIWGMKTSGCFLSNCYNGIYCENEHEYSQYTDISVTLCQIGVYVNTGNLMFSQMNVTRNIVGFMFKNGYNNAHGIVSNSAINHNMLAGVFLQDISNGQLFSCINLYYSNFLIRNCRGVNINTLNGTSSTISCTGNFPDPGDASKTGKNIAIGILGDINLVNYGNLVVVDNYNFLNSI